MKNYLLADFMHELGFTLIGGIINGIEALHFEINFDFFQRPFLAAGIEFNRNYHATAERTEQHLGRRRSTVRTAILDRFIDKPYVVTGLRLGAQPLIRPNTDC